MPSTRTSLWFPVIRKSTSVNWSGSTTVSKTTPYISSNLATLKTKHHRRYVPIHTQNKELQVTLPYTHLKTKYCRQQVVSPYTHSKQITTSVKSLYTLIMIQHRQYVPMHTQSKDHTRYGPIHSKQSTISSTALYTKYKAPEPVLPFSGHIDYKGALSRFWSKFCFRF